MSLSTAVVVVLSLLTVIAVCGSGVGILICCVLWIKHSESVWTKAEREGMKRVKRGKRNGAPRQLKPAKTNTELLKQTGFTNLTANLKHSNYDTRTRKTTEQRTNSTEMAQNETYAETRHQEHIIQEDTCTSQLANNTSDSNRAIETVQNALYCTTVHIPATELGHSNSVDSMHSLVGREQGDKENTTIKTASNVAYVYSHNSSGLDVIYEELPEDSVTSKIRVQKGGKDHKLNEYVNVHSRSETTL